jgi:phosphate:Na+ symporter
MTGTLVLLQLAGFVAMFLWGLHMVHTGVLRSFGADLRRVLATALDNRWKAFIAGLGVTTALQSSTATGLMTASFLAGGLMGLVPALAVMLGANVGSTLIVQVLSFNVSAVAPVLILAGLIAFRQGGKTRVRDLGRVGIGLGLMLLGLHAIIAAIAPVEHAQALRLLLTQLTSDPVLNMLVGALMTWGAFSSVVVILLVMSLASAKIIAPAAVLSLVLGANLGTVIPQFLAARANASAQRLVLGNLIVRAAGCLIVLPFLPSIAEAVAAIDPDPARQAANFHTIFNLALAIVFIGLLGPLAKLCEDILPSSQRIADPASPVYLAVEDLHSPTVALASAKREVLRIVDIIESMLNAFLDAIASDDRKKVAEVRRLDDTLDTLHTAVKTYLTQISREDGLTEANARLCSDILTFTINLEHAGDILDNSLSELASKKIKNRLSFSPEGFADIKLMHAHVRRQLGVAVSVFMTGDEGVARALLAEKVTMRDLEKQATEAHLTRLRQGNVATVETSALHLDIIRDLKRITSHLASVAYPILEESGSIRRSRVTDESTAPVPDDDGVSRLKPL